MSELIKIKDMYNDAGHWLTATGITIVGQWTDHGNTQFVDNRILNNFSEKYFSAHLQKLTKSEITDRVVDYINSIVYELDTLYLSTQQDYNPISNYDMTESGRDETRSSASGDSTAFSTTYDDSTTDRKTGKTTTSGSTNEAFIHNLSRSGNIGVTTSQQMLQSERDIAKFDFIGYVAERVASEFTASLYEPLRADWEVLI